MGLRTGMDSGSEGGCKEMRVKATRRHRVSKSGMDSKEDGMRVIGR